MFEGDPIKCNFSFKDFSLRIGDSEIISCLEKAGVSSPDIFSLVWGLDMVARNNMLFPPKLQEIVNDILREVKKKKEAIDSQGVRIHGVVIDLLQVLYEREVNSIVESILEIQKRERKPH